MGRKVPPPDERTHQTIEKLKLTESDIQTFWNVFCRFDRDHTGVLDLDHFFRNVLGQKRTKFGDGIFRLVEVGNIERIHFGEFLQAVCTFALFQVEEMQKFVFWQCDKAKRGYIEREELHYFLESVHDGIKGNIKTALNTINNDNNGMIHYDGFSKLCKQCSAMLYPVFTYQQNMCDTILGEVWWSKKRKQLYENKTFSKENAETRRRKEEHRLLAQRRSLIRSEVGFLPYYFGSSRRKHYERMHPKPVVYLDDDNDVRVKYDNDDYE